MNKMKKFLAGTLASVICITSVMAKAPTTAHAACNHVIYKTASYVVSQKTHTHAGWTVDSPQKGDGLGGLFISNEPYFGYKCTEITTHDYYHCVKCSYAYDGYSTHHVKQ